MKMLEPTEFEGKTTERAIEAACVFFNCTEDDLEIEIVTKGSTGIFGLGGRKAKIRAIPKKQPEPSEAIPDKKDTEIKEEPYVQPQAEEKALETDSREKITEVPDAVIDTPNQEHLEQAKEIVDTILANANLSGKVSINSDSDNDINLNIEGEDISLIIGRDGQTLNALEYLLNRILRHRGLQIRIQIDAQGYRAKKQEALERLAHRMAKKAKQSGRSVALQPMGPKERRIVHLTLKEVRGIATRSIGEGTYRKVLITPSRRRGKSRYSQKN